MQSPHQKENVEHKNYIYYIICFYLTAPCPRSKRGPVEVNGKGLRQTMDIQWLKLKLIFFYLILF